MSGEEIVVIGGGQAGLAVSRCLQRRGIDPLVLDASERVGDRWRKRYDSLLLFTPNRYNSLPDLAFPGPPDAYPTKDQAADYLETYARHHRLRVRSGCRVDRLALTPDGRFRLDTGDGTIDADQVVVATGALQRPAVPGFAANLGDGVKQPHSSQYRNPDDIAGERVLVVGAGNSGGQIAEELANRFDTTISYDHLPRRFPQRLLGRDIFWWFLRLGVLDRGRDETGSSEAAVGAIPLIGSSVPRLVRRGQLRRVRRITGAVDDAVSTAGGGRLRPSTVIWATGFRNDFSWIDIPDALDPTGRPNHHRGISTTIPGLSFIGLPGLHTKGSAFLGFVHRDAEHTAGTISDPVRRS